MGISIRIGLSFDNRIDCKNILYKEYCTMNKLLYKEPSIRVLCFNTSDIITASVDDETFNLKWLDESLFS